ncbi:putative serine/threonine kinase [Calothrix sp. PCC 7716]|nr:putative serine/threonine kinase [Calothrix sp. PCC 7716]
MTSTESFYREYPCTHNNALNCDKPLETVKALEAMQEFKGAKFCFECGFPAVLPEEAEIKGNRGGYRVTKYLGVRGFGRLYSGIQIKDQQPVLIKEYLLPSRSFNQDETFQRKETFRSVGGVELADGRVQNFRLIQTWEAIAPEKGERCYLITKDIQPSQTLSQYLKRNGAMAPEQVREFLDEVIQTLVFMHTQKLRFTSNRIQKGLVHGNINLDSVLIKVENKQRFVAYLCDIALWENLFIPPVISQTAAKTPAQDLEALGLVAFHLWVGKNQLLDPKDHLAWPDDDIYLKQYLYRLLSLNTPFPSAEIARQELLKLPQKTESRNLQPKTSPEKQKRLSKKYWLGLTLLLILLLSGALWYFLWRRHQNEIAEDKNSAWQALVANFSDVNNVTSGNFSYSIESESTWSFILTQQSDSEKRLENILTKPKPETEATFTYQKIVSQDISKASAPIQNIQNSKTDFAMTSLEDKVTIDLNKKPIAYDGLLVFVAFSKNNFNLPLAINGRISLEQLRGIYTGQIKDWKQINPNIPFNLTIEPIVPTEPEARQQFKKLVLKNDQDIALFNDIAKSPQNTGNTHRQMRTAIDRKQNTGIISFGILSKTWNQCAGYPLAIVDNNNQTIQPLFRKVHKRPINPNDDLCDKANYFDTETFHTNEIVNYPLGYPLYVVYPKDNSRQSGGLIFAEMLKTREGQCLLTKVGLVPLQPMPNDINYACKSVSKP